MKYVCENPECHKFGIEDYYVSETFSYRDGRLVGKNAICPHCGKERKEVNANDNVPLSEKNIGVNLFQGMSTEQKREALRKRSHQHFKKEIKERKDGMLNQAMTEMKDLTRIRKK